MAYVDKEKIPYYLDTSENAPIEGRMIAFKSDIDKLPTADVVEVVRCGECERRSKGADLTSTIYCKWFKKQMDKTDFCSYGQRNDKNG